MIIEEIIRQRYEGIKNEKGVYEISIEGQAGYDLRRNLFALLTRKGWPLLALKNTDLTLEEVFLQLTSSDASHVQQEEDDDAVAEADVELEETEANAENKEDADK